MGLWYITAEKICLNKEAYDLRRFSHLELPCCISEAENIRSEYRHEGAGPDKII